MLTHHDDVPSSSRFPSSVYNQAPSPRTTGIGFGATFICVYGCHREARSRSDRVYFSLIENDSEDCRTDPVPHWPRAQRLPESELEVQAFLQEHQHCHSARLHPGCWRFVLRPSPRLQFAASGRGELPMSAACG